MTMMVAKAVDQQGGKKRKDKVVDAGRPKEASSPLRRTRSRTLILSKDTDNAGAAGPPAESGRSNGKQHGGVGTRKRSREVIVAPRAPTPKKASARIRNSKFSPNLARIIEEKSWSPSEDEAAVVDARSSTPLQDEIAPRSATGTPRPTGTALRRKVTTTLQRRAAAKDLQKKAATVKKAVAKETSTIVVKLARAKSTPLPGLQELRRSTRPSVAKQSKPSKLLDASVSTKEQEDMAAGQEKLANNNVRETRSSKSTTNALRIAEDATGFVRTAMNAVAESRMKEEQQRSKTSVVDVSAAEIISKDESQSQRSRANSSRSIRSRGSTRSRKSLTAEKLIQELDSYSVPSKPGGMDMKEKLRKGISRLTRSQTKLAKQQGNSPVAMKKASIPAKLPRVANQENLPKATESALVRRVKSDIEDHAKKYGLLDQEKALVPPGRAGRKGPASPGGLGLQGSGSEPPEDDGSQSDWTPEQEMAFQNAYISVKPAQDFWYHISKRVPGKTADECFNKFYAGHPTPPPAAAQRSKRQTGNVAEDGTDFLVKSNPKRKTARGKQRLLEARRTIRTILRKQQVDDEEYEADAFEALERPDVVDSVLNSEEANEAVIFKVTEVPATRESKTDSSSRPFENIVIGGLSTCDKENRNAALSGKGSRMLPDTQAQLSSPEVLKVVKDPAQLDKYIDHLHQRHHTRRARTIGSQKPLKKSNVYLHSKEALDLGDNTLTAIQRAKEELRNVFLKSGAAGASFVDIMGPGEDEGEGLEEEREGEFFSDGDG